MGPSRSRPPGLRIATHNVTGLSSAAAVFSLVHSWHAANLDIVCLQETWAGRPSSPHHTFSQGDLELWLRQATDSLHLPPYTIFWASTAPPFPGNNGVAIVARPAPSLNLSLHSPSPTGRLQHLRVSWGGHSFSLVNSYWPSTSPSDRASFLSTALDPLLPTLVSPWLVGDFNFTPDPLVDRLLPAVSTVSADSATTALLSATLPSHLDAYRLRHPSARSFTFHRGSVLARLDRIYIPPSFAPFTHSCSILYSPRGDHHALVLHLLPALPLLPLGPGRRPLPSALPVFAPAADSLAAWATRAVAYGLRLPLVALLDWWPTALRAYVSHARILAHSSTRARLTAAAALDDAQASLTAAMHVVESASPPTLPSALCSASAARSHLRSLASVVATPASALASRAWLHTNECPSPLLTSLLRPPASSTSVPLLRSPSGSFLSSNLDIANCLASHYATISRAPLLDFAAQDLVLAALHDDVVTGRVLPIPLDLSLAAGAAAITTHEVRLALAQCPAHSSPGPDKLPYSLWRVGNGSWAPLLARLFTAIGTTGCPPDAFNLGSVTPILKPDQPDCTAPVAYRPITLLPTLYRILAKILSTRFSTTMACAIGPEQSAYLPSRQIGDNVNFTSLLPHILIANGATGAHVFIDISKAYDTLDREFIFRVMTTMGASPGMVNWARILLYHTRASTHVNGVESSLLTWEAGVRQGCPLAPLLYLFVAQALTSWLRAQPLLGVTVSGVRYVSSHFADDTTIHLGDLSPAALASLTSALTTFGSAAGQRINPAKSSALLIGLPHPHPPPTTLAGIPVVASTVSLGILQVNPSPPLPCAPHGHFTRSSLRPPVPSLPPASSPLVLDAWAARLHGALRRASTIARLPLSALGRGLAASSYAMSHFLYFAEFTGLPPDLPCPSSDIARAVSRTVPPALLTGSPASGGFGLLPLRAHTLARHAVTASRLLFHLLPPAPLSASASPSTAPTFPAPPPWIALAAALLTHACPSLHPAQTLLAATVSTPADVARGVLGIPALPQPHRLPPGLLTLLASALMSLGPLSAPPSGPPALFSLTTPLLSPLSVRDSLLALTWPHPASSPTRPRPPLAPAGDPISVRTFTAVLSSPTRSLRHACHTAFLRLALPPVAPSARSASLATFHGTLRSVWRLPCPNSLKETLWRLAIDAIPGSRFHPWSCPCSLTAPPLTTARCHSFWDCPIALAVRSQIAPALSPSPLTRASLWLLLPPSPTLSPPVWSLVCLSALDAMEYGRRRLWAHCTCSSLPAPDVPAIANAAAARFWHNLHDVVLALPVSPWLLGPNHPFLAARGGSLLVQAPPSFPPSPLP